VAGARQAIFLGMHYVVIERFQGGNPVPVYARLRAQGRLAPEGLHYVGSWVSRDLGTCYQIMECADRALLDAWIARWADLVDFEVIPAMTSAEAAAAVPTDASPEPSANDSDVLPDPSTPRAADTLETELLRFRRFREADFPTYEQWCARMEIMRYLGGKTFDRVHAWRHLAYMMGHWDMLGYGYYAVEEKATGTLIGRMGFTNQAGWPGFELGWTVVPEYQGRGYATEGSRMLLRYAFDVLGRERVISLIHPDNAPSRRVAEKLGQRVEGETEVLTMPVLVYAARRSEWAER
jgi:RimJ/RimL family protein N-acetyltransferase